MSVIETIPKSESDLLMNELGFDLMRDYSDLINNATMPLDKPILDIATGTGRSASILTRMGYSVFTGDYNNRLKEESALRITNEFVNNVKFIRLNLESIPFPDNSIENIICIDTMHELENPLLCLEEIIRIHSPGGVLLLADFNDTGFDLMDNIHLKRYGKLHTRGKIIRKEIEQHVNKHYNIVKVNNTKLNFGFTLSGKLTR